MRHFDGICVCETHHWGTSKSLKEEFADNLASKRPLILSSPAIIAFKATAICSGFSMHMLHVIPDAGAPECYVMHTLASFIWFRVNIIGIMRDLLNSDISGSRFKRSYRLVKPDLESLGQIVLFCATLLCSHLPKQTTIEM